MRREIAVSQVWLLCVVMLVLSAAVGCTVYGGKNGNTWKGATGGEDLERRFWADIRSKNFSELEKHMAVTWVYLSPSGPLDRAATIDHLRHTPVPNYSLGDFKVMPNGADMVVTYTAVPKGDKETETSPIRMMTVWQKGEKDWLAIAHAEVR